MGGVDSVHEVLGRSAATTHPVSILTRAGQSGRGIARALFLPQVSESIRSCTRAETVMSLQRAEAERWARVEAVQEAHIERQRQEFEARKVQEQQQRSQAQAEAIAATQGSGEATAEPAVVTGGRRSACVRCREHLNNPVGCVAQASSKVTACARCQAAHKSCSWSMAGKVAEVSTPAVSRTKQVWYSEHGR